MDSQGTFLEAIVVFYFSYITLEENFMKLSIFSSVFFFTSLMQFREVIVGNLLNLYARGRPRINHYKQ